ncbi:MAG: carboxypeptidase regulatory-like domain-containing protein [Pyrinomonadaceae bacterium]
MNIFQTALVIFLAPVFLFVYGLSDFASEGTAQISFPSSSGALDLTFSLDGIVNTPIGPGNDVAQAVAIQPDGKIVVAGYSFNGTYDDFAVVRYNADGSLDSGFGQNGVATTSVGIGHDEAFGLALQSDGKIVVVGQSANGSNTDIGVVRYHDNGSLDLSFADDGLFTFDFGENDHGRSVAIQSDARIVIAGNSFQQGNSDVAVLRLDSQGALDPSFRGVGFFREAVGTGNDLGFAITVQPNGKVLVSGYYNGALNIDSFILRYNPDGAGDPTFSGDGIAKYSFSTDDVDEALAIALQPDGRIVVAGCIRGSGRLNDYLVARLEPDGSLDTSFGTGGFTIVQFSSAPDIALGVAVQADGKIIAAGFAHNGANNDFGVTRLTAAGALDATFDIDGRQQTMFGTSTDSANAVAVQADGKVVVVGRAVVGSSADFGIARYGYGLNEQQNDGFFALDAATAVRFDNAFQSGTSSAMVRDVASVAPLAAGWSHITPPRQIQTNAMFSGNVSTSFILPSTVSVSDFSSARVLQHENGNWIDRTSAMPPRDFVTRSIYARSTSLGTFAVVLAPSVEVSGEVRTPDGRGLRNAVVTMSNSQGDRRSVTTNSFGFYTILNVAAGQVYSVTVKSKRYRFAARSVAVDQSLTDLNFIGLE